MRAVAAALIVVTGGAAACGGGQHRDSDDELASFDCDGRMVGYVARGTMAAAEVGIAVDCAERGPRIVRWQVQSDGTRAEDSHSLSTGEFDTLWRKIDATGWRDLGDCESSGDNAPTYSFCFKQADQSNTADCQSDDPPFPWHTIRDELDTIAARGGQLQPDDVAPDEVKPAKGKGKGR